MGNQSIANKSVGQQVLIAVGEAENTAVESLPSLSDTIDPVALNELFQTHDDITDTENVSFGFSESIVSVDYGDDISVRSDNKQDVDDADTSRSDTTKSVINEKWDEL